MIQELKAQLAKEESELRIVEEATRHGALVKKLQPMNVDESYEGRIEERYTEIRIYYIQCTHKSILCKSTHINCL